MVSDDDGDVAVPSGQGVLILVLMEYGLWQRETRTDKNHQKES